MDSIVKLGAVSLSAVVGFFGFLFIITSFGYHEKSLVMSVAMVGAILASLVSVKYIRKLPQSNSVKVSVLYLLSGVLLFSLSVLLFLQVVQ